MKKIVSALLLLLLSSASFAQEISPAPGTSGGGGGSGTVTSVTFTGDGTVLSSTTSSAVTTSGTLTATLATQTANTLLGALTATTPSDIAVPSCSATGSALRWTTGTGFNCNNAIAASTVTTNANLTGVITSVGNATSIASQTGTGSTFATAASPTFTGTVGAAAITATGAISGATFVSPPTSLVISTATFTPTFATSNNFTLTLVHASCPCTLANPSGTVVPGESGIIVVNQSSTGSDLISTYGTDYKFANGVKPTLSTGVSALDVLTYYNVDATHIVIGANLNFQ